MMRFLIVGAGAVGGYFGGRLLQKGEDVTFLVRANRRKQLLEKGLVIRSLHGDFQGAAKTVSADEAGKPPMHPYDVILLALKAYHLPAVLTELDPFIGEKTVMLPLMNGYQHFPQLRQRFSANNVLGGLCFLESTLQADGTVVQSSPRHDIMLGEWSGERSARVENIFDHLNGAGFNVTLSDNIVRDIWLKYMFIAAMSGITCLMNSPIGPIMQESGGKSVYTRLISEITEIALASRAPIPPDAAERTLKTTEALKAEMKSSMQRDMEKGFPTETDHLHGALLTLARENAIAADQVPVLQTVYSRIKIYENQRLSGRPTEK